MTKKKRPFARKRFGQHFLVDENIINRIITESDVTPEDHIIEIGPGRGALTKKILDKGASLTVIEIDRDLSSDLLKEYCDRKNFSVIQADVLKINWEEHLKADVKYKLIANLPYNISTPLFFKLVVVRQHFSSITVMLQNEVAERICHDGEGKSLKEYGALSVVSNLVFDSKILFQVSQNCFNPRPKVNSAVIRLIPKTPLLDNEEDFFEFVRNAFNFRRKLLIKQLKALKPELVENLPERDYELIKRLRPENLKPFQYINLYKEGRLEVEI